MSQGDAGSVQVTIAGRSFRMACAPGEEERLGELAAQIDARIAELRASFGEIGDQRLTVMAAITIADELSETRRQNAELQARMEAVQHASAQKEEAASAWVESLAQTLDLTARRIESIAHAVAGSKG